MYKKVEPVVRMTSNEAAEHYPDCYIVFRRDSMNPSNNMGAVLYVGDDRRELFSLVTKLSDPTNCGVSEGINLQRSLGGVVVGT